MTNASNYHVATQGKFKKVDFDVFKLMQEYFIYRRLKNKPEFIEVEGPQTAHAYNDADLIFGFPHYLKMAKLLLL